MCYSVITCQPLEMTRGTVNSVHVNPVNYMYIQFTGSTSPRLSRVLVCTARAVGLNAVTPPSKHKAFNVGQRRRRWPNIETVLGECLVFAVRTAS